MAKFNKSLDAFFDSLIPTGLRTTLKADTASYVRVQALSVMLVMITGIIGIGAFIVAGTHLWLHPDLLKYDMVSLAVFVLLAMQTWFFYKFNNYWMSGLAFTNFYFLIVTVLMIMSGGYEAPGKMIMLTSPLISFLIGGRQEGIQNSVMTILFGLALIILKAIEFQLPNVFREESPYLIFIVDWIYTSLIILACILVYETEIQKTHCA